MNVCPAAAKHLTINTKTDALNQGIGFLYITGIQLLKRNSQYTYVANYSTR